MNIRNSSAALATLALWGIATFAPNIGTQGSDERASGVTLTNDTLKSTLDGLGYEPKALSKGFLVALKKDSWTINMQLVLSPDQTKLGINANLGAIEKMEDVPAATWLALLQENANIDPSSFYVDKDQKKLYLHRVLDNRAITPAYIRKQVETFAGNVRDTEALWKFTK